MITIKFGEKEYQVSEARTEEEKQKGLSGIKELPENEGMIFYWDEPSKASFWMHETYIPLDIIFINEDQRVIKVYKGEPEDDTMITVRNVMYVVELNQGSGVKKGDELEFEEDAPVMRVLALDGSTLMELWGSERIFRRAFTKLLVRAAKNAEAVKDNEEEYDRLCRNLGRKMFREIKALDERPAEYVQTPDSNN